MAAVLGMKVALPVKAVRPSRSGLQRCTKASIGLARGLGTSARQNVVAGAAAAIEPTLATPAGQVPFLSDEERQKYAESIGFTKVGKHLPDEVTLQDVIKTLPSEVFEINPLRAWSAVAISIFTFALSEYLISISPWYLLPFAWAFAGTAFTGWFVVGHDCGHRSFSKNKLVEDIVGTIAFMPLIYPFEPWRIKHNVHHAYTNKLVDDTAWHPMTKENLEKMDPVTTGFFKFFLGSPLKLWASIGHWWIWHFDLSKYSEAQKPRVKVSLAAVYAFMLIGWPLIIYYFGLGGFAKYWLMPWLGYHFWMSTFTLVHHTSPHIPFKGGKEWNPAQAQLAGTIHCEYPRWVDFLCHDISVHIPHHVNAKIPWYNLRKAHDSLKQNWGEYMNETTFNWRMIKQVITQCHVYDEENCYVPFDYKKEEPFLAMQRKLLPETFKAN